MDHEAFTENIAKKSMSNFHEFISSLYVGTLFHSSRLPLFFTLILFKTLSLKKIELEFINV